MISPFEIPPQHGFCIGLDFKRQIHHGVSMKISEPMMFYMTQNSGQSICWQKPFVSIQWHPLLEMVLYL